MTMTKKHITTLLMGMTMAAALTACALPPAPPPKTENTNMPAQTESAANALADTQWVLETLGGNPPVPQTQVTLNFISASQAAGTDGCNRFTGGYTVDGSALTFGPLAGTMMACPDPIMTQARSFTQSLAATKTFGVANGRLSLMDESGATLATFTSVSTALAGTKWDVTNFNNGNQAVVGVIEGTTLTVEFGADGKVAGNAGCNNYFGPFTQDKGTITIGPLGSTMMACETPAGTMDQEAQFLKALESAATTQLDGDMLTLRTKDDAMAVVMRRAP